MSPQRLSRAITIAAVVILVPFVSFADEAKAPMKSERALSGDMKTAAPKPNSTKSERAMAPSDPIPGKVPAKVDEK